MATWRVTIKELPTIAFAFAVECAESSLIFTEDEEPTWPQTSLHVVPITNQ